MITRLAFRIKVRTQLRFRYKPESLPVNSAQRPLVNFVVKDDGKCLLGTCWQNSPELHVSASLGDELESESGKNLDQVST